METHQLEAKLKSLRLSGMLATLEARLAQGCLLYTSDAADE